jgi:7-cyano-7-deazaguanine reductase
MENPLGKTTSYSDVFDPSLLFPIARAQSRMQLGIKDHLPFVGVDRWTCYELSWLNREGIPQVAVASIQYPAHSPKIVESKSLKLYLGSMNFTRFDSASDVVATIQKGLCSVLESDEVRVLLVQPDHWSELAMSREVGECIDNEKPARDGSSRLKSGEGEVTETLYSNLLRSLCPVTSQPDWGTVILRYRGKPLDRSSLLSYLIAHRSYQGFHEECCERIFTDIAMVCAPSELWIGCFYTRRGGIDINPERWMVGSERPIVEGRFARQ